MAQEPTPAPLYQTDEFVNREEELRLIRRKIEQGRSGHAIQSCVVHFHGMPRIGKTWLLNHLAHQHRHEPAAMPATKGVFALFLEGSTLPGDGQLEDEIVSRVLTDLQNTLQDQMPQKSPDSIRGVADLLAGLTKAFVPLLLLDAAEVLSEPDFRRIEEELLAPLARTDQSVLVISGEGNAPRWHLFETRRRLEKCTLPPLNMDETAEQVRKLGIRIPVTQVYPHSGGHPFASRILCQAVDQLTDESEIARLLLSVENQLLRGLPKETQTAVRVISVLRWFGSEPMSTFLANAVAAKYGDRSASYYLGMLDELRQRGLGDYTIPAYFKLAPAARQILKQRLYLSCPDLYQRAQRAAIELHHQWMDAYPEDCGRFLQEAIYHTVELWAIMEQPKEEIRGELVKLLQLRLTEGNFSPDQASELISSLQNDTELRQTIPAPVFRELLQHLEEFVQRLKAADRILNSFFAGGVSWQGRNQLGPLPGERSG